MSEPRTAHPVYPGGPGCQPNCPGPWSMYHDGYADGYERAEAEARSTDDLRAALWSLYRAARADHGGISYPSDDPVCHALQRIEALASPEPAPLVQYRCDFDCDVCAALRVAKRAHDETHGEPEQCGPECVPFLDIAEGADE